MSVSKRKNTTDADIQAIVNLSGVKANQPQKILQGISHFSKPEEAIDFVDSEISRYTTSNFSMAWFYEEVKRLAMACMSCSNFSGLYGNCEKLMQDECQLHLEEAFYKQKTVIQEIAEELGIPYIQV